MNVSSYIIHVLHWKRDKSGDKINY